MAAKENGQNETTTMLNRTSLSRSRGVVDQPGMYYQEAAKFKRTSTAKCIKTGGGGGGKNSTLRRVSFNQQNGCIPSRASLTKKKAAQSNHRITIDFRKHSNTIISSHTNECLIDKMMLEDGGEDDDGIDDLEIDELIYE
jgi:hypothetical protein